MKRKHVKILTMSLAAVMATVLIFSATADMLINDMQISGPNWSPDGKYIAFTSFSYETFKQDIFTYDLESGEITNISGHIPAIITDHMREISDRVDYDQAKYGVKFSADSQEVYYTHDNYYTENDPDWHFSYFRKINLATGEHSTVLDDGWCGSLSYDNKYVLYSRLEKNNAIFDMETGEVRVYDFSDPNVVPNTDLYCIGGNGSIHPDNSNFLTYLHALDHTAQFDELNDQWKIFKVDIETGEAEMLPLPDDFNYKTPRYSPDGTKVLVATTDYYPEPSKIRDMETGALFEEVFNTLDLGYINEDTHRMVRIETYEDYLELRTEFIIWFKPDSFENYLFVEQPDYKPDSATRKSSMGIFDVESGDFTAIDPPEGHGYSGFCWSPDGSQICYALSEEFSGVDALYILDLNTGVHKAVIPAYTVTDPTSVEADTEPTEFALTGNYPNPFNPTTTIEFSLEKAGDVSLDVFNVMGQKVCTLESSVMTPGAHAVVWNGRDDAGNPVSSGVYICRLKVGAAVQSTQMLLAK